MFLLCFQEATMSIWVAKYPTTDDEGDGQSQSHSDGSSDIDPEYDASKEIDKGEPEDQHHHDHDIATSQNQASGNEKSKEVAKKCPQVEIERKGRGPTKSLNVEEPMYLEYDEKGQPCGKWRSKYGEQVGICMRRLNINIEWKEVEEGEKNAMWDDTVVCETFKIYCLM